MEQFIEKVETEEIHTLLLSMIGNLKGQSDVLYSPSKEKVVISKIEKV